MFRTLVVMLALAGLIGATAAVSRAQPIEEYTPPKFDGRVGQIQVRNPFSSPVTVTMWHPDSRDRFASYHFQPGQVGLLSDGGVPITIGSDWGVQINDGPIFPVRDGAPLVRPGNGASYWNVSLDQLR
jgi:hypothetical protein